MFMDKIELKVRDAIVFCIENGIESAKGQLESYDKAKPNRLSTKDQIDSLKKNLECFFENADITGGGKRGKVFLSGRKEKVTEREDRRKGNKRPAAEETTLIREFIFNQLVRIIGDEESVTMPLSKWYEYIGLYSLGHNEVMKFHELLQDKYRPFHSTIKIKGMREEVKEAMNERINYVHNYAFKQLVKAERIETNRIYKMVICDEMVERIEGDLDEKIYPVQQMSDKMLEDVQMGEAEKAEELGVSFEDYQTARIRPRYAKKAAKKILPEMDEMLIDRFGIKSYFRELEISIINPSIVRDVSKKEARNVFIDKTIELHLKKCEKEEYTRATTYSKKFFRLNFLLLLQMKGVGGLENDIGTELFTLKFRIDEVRRSYVEKLKQEDKGNGADALIKDIERASDEHKKIPQTLPVVSVGSYETSESAHDADILNVLNKDIYSNQIELVAPTTLLEYNNNLSNSIIAHQKENASEIIEVDVTDRASDRQKEIDELNECLLDMPMVI